MSAFSQFENGVFRSVCPLDCPDTCALHVHKENGKIVKVTGNPDHPVTQGAICNKVRNMAERIYHPDRIQYPMKRIGAKGEGKFERITWQEAIDEIVQRFQQIIKEHGSEAILPYSFYGNMGILNVDGMDRRFFHRLGASKLDQTICSVAGSLGFRYTMGIPGGIDPEETTDSKLIIIWGGNLASTNMHQVALAEKARKKGATIVVIDVHKNQTGRWADWFIPLRPGTDAALALGMMHVLFAEQLVDESFLQQYTYGYEQLREHVKSYPVDKISRITGVPEEDIVRLARLYGATSPSYIHIGNGLQHHDNGGMNVRTIACLPALTGQWAKRGGGATRGNSWYARVNGRALERADLRPNPKARSVNMNRIGEALLALDPPIRAMFVYCSNPAVVAPESGKVQQGLMREDLFTVVHDLFITDTAKYADLLLPATSSFENTDLYNSYWHHYIQLQEPVIPIYGESKSNYELFRTLAKAMGFKDDAFDDTEEDMIRQALDNPSNPYLEGVTLEDLKEHGWKRLSMDRERPFLKRLPTSSGKIALYSTALEKKGLPPLPTYMPLKEGYDGESQPGAGEAFPLMFISPPNHNFLNSTFANVPKLQKIEKRPTLQIHPDDAALRGISDGELVDVFNERGQIELTALVTENLLPGVVVSQGLWWEGEKRSQRVNVLTPNRSADMGGGATFFSTTVEVRKNRGH
ncbi:molybdopterin-containing oxidoreductase family protein [Paenibacillus beijingensis]|uniref:Oxidoreductase n=1 Tax=Paenibacillus beijingensis TaxID=1126833 RepID=A0A0D5NN52_9BACL|nr:molybdopterin oxidoreductase family protein [Paenibacillus beijingensis]AJY76681.1 oxidoreductase [Paenibacillus beijingensis]